MYEGLSAQEVAELCSDHLASEAPIDESSLPLSFAQGPPAVAATDLGQATLDVATEFLKMPLREDAGVNVDKQGHIRTFFLEGLKWSPDTWDHWAEKHPGGIAKPEWCAAFGSYCARKAYAAAGLKLPATPSGSASEMASRFTAVKRLLTREELFDSDGSIRSGVTPPGPGDLVVWHGHVGILRDIYADGSFTTIEGNTWRGSTRNDGVYLCERSSLEKRGDGTYKLVGFCLLASVDGKAAQAQQEPAPASEPAPAGETEPEPAPAT